MKNLMKILFVLLVAILVIGVSNIVLATENDEETVFIPDEGPENTQTTIPENQNTNTDVNSLFGNNTNTNTNINANTNANINANANTNTDTNTINNVNNNINTNNDTNSSTYNNTNLPKAGSSDSIVVIVMVAIFGASALYAYKKIRDYNIR